MHNSPPTHQKPLYGVVAGRCRHKIATPPPPRRSTGTWGAALGIAFSGVLVYWCNGVVFNRKCNNVAAIYGMVHGVAHGALVAQSMPRQMKHTPMARSVDHLWRTCGVICGPVRGTWLWNPPHPLPQPPSPLWHSGGMARQQNNPPFPWITT